MNPRPIPADRENQHVLMELGHAIGQAFDRSEKADQGADLFDAALRHLPRLIQNLSDGGLVLAKGEGKLFRGQRRRKIRASTWRHLGNVARQLDMTRPQLLRALLRLELGLARPFHQGEGK